MICKICGEKVKVTFIPKGQIFFWRMPRNANPNWFNRQEFSLGSDWKTNIDLKKISCSCGYEEFKKV